MCTGTVTNSATGRQLHLIIHFMRLLLDVCLYPANASQRLLTESLTCISMDWRPNLAQIVQTWLLF